MIEGYTLAAVALLAAGAVVGFLAVVRLGIHREGRRGAFPADTEDPIARGVRRVTGLGARGMTIPASGRIVRGVRVAEGVYDCVPGGDPGGQPSQPRSPAAMRLGEM
jgi:hypothetical protein